MTEPDLSRAVWHKSRHSSQDGNCVEVATLPAWHTSSYSSGSGACVEVATNLPDEVAVRDSKERGGAVLAFSAEVWREFTGRVKSGQVNAS
jgi:hypothetical protein